MSKKPNTLLDLPYRACVGIALINHEGKIFVGERLDNPGAWQMPQGGIDEGEDIEQAFFRELLEEAGTDKAEIVKVLETPLRYDLPDHLLGKLWNGKYRGQEQVWVAANFTGNDDDINIFHDRKPEFKSWRSSGTDEMLELIVPFKRDTYETVIDFLRSVPDINLLK